MFSAVIAGIAGALYVPQVGIINPSEFAPINSIEVVIWVAVGGRGTLYGAVAGAVLVNYAKTFFTGALPGGLALRARRAVRPGHAVPAARAHRACVPRASNATMIEPHSARAAPARTRSSYLENLTVSFDGFKALNELTLYVEPGELRCIIGPNGAGKTTMMDVITGKTRPDSGHGVVRPDDRSARSCPSRKSRRPASAASFRSRRVFEQLTVFENLELALAGDKSFWKTLLARLTRGAARAHRRGARDHRPRRAARDAGAARCRTARSSGSRSACC